MAGVESYCVCDQELPEQIPRRKGRARFGRNDRQPITLTGSRWTLLASSMRTLQGCVIHEVEGLRIRELEWLVVWAVRGTRKPAVVEERQQLQAASDKHGLGQRRPILEPLGVAMHDGARRLAARVAWLRLTADNGRGDEYCAGLRPHRLGVAPTTSYLSSRHSLMRSSNTFAALPCTSIPHAKTNGWFGIR